MFRVGQKVVCIHNGNWLTPKNHGEIMPEFNAVYTIRDIEDRPPFGLTVRLVEIVNQPHRYTIGVAECCFLARYFRPIVERKTDISIFTALLNTKKMMEPANG